MDIVNLINKTPRENFSAGRNGWNPGLITLHIAAGSYKGTLSWFANPQSGVSSHFVISKTGEVAQCVSLQDTAFVNGTTIGKGTRCYLNATNPIVKARKTNANNYTIGIEFEGTVENGICKMTEAQEQACVNLIKYIVKAVKEQFGVSIPVDRTRICGHYEVTPQHKPFCGRGFPYDRIIQNVNK